jgi:hypothetical protein
MWNGRDRRMKRTVLDYLLRAEPALRRHRERVLAAIALMMTAVAAADMRLWHGISLAFGYSLPVALGAYALGIRVGVALSVLSVILRGAFAGRTYGAWWIYAGSVLMLAEYLLLAVGVGLLGRAVARLERQTRVLRHLNELGRNLAAMRDPEGIRRAGVEGAVRLTGADGGFLAAQHAGSWRAAAVFRRGQWHEHGIVWLSDATPEDASRQLEAPIQIAAPVTLPGGTPAYQLVVFRAVHGPFTPATSEVLTLAALHMTTALYVASGPPAFTRPTPEAPAQLGSVS